MHRSLASIADACEAGGAATDRPERLGCAILTLDGNGFTLSAIKTSERANNQRCCVMPRGSRWHNLR
eukprot:1693740-Alexandrium_andersonii.AAC.1